MREKQDGTVVTVTGEQTQETKNKIEWIVNLRAFACMAVVLLHASEMWINSIAKFLSLSTPRQFLYKMIIPMLTRFAVPTFIMISGCLLLNPKREVDIEKIKKYILKMLCLLGTFGFAFCIIENIFNFGMSDMVRVIYKSIFDLLQAKSWGHMWYLYMLIGLYILTPILRKFVEHTDDASAKFTLGMLFLVSAVIPTINGIFGLSLTTFYLNMFVYIFLFLMGYYIVHTNVITDKTIYIGGAIGIIGHVVLSYFVKSFSMNVFILLEAMLIVKLFSSGKIKIRNNWFTNCISKYSLGIYVVHAFWVNLAFKGFGIYPTVLPIGIGEIVFFAYVLIASLVTSMFLYKMPIVKKLW